ncbi:hypothetical protein BLNAU_11402 [Blattamonas nauphoetae]|uniref:Right handed beta helix domain-containing protein n=1 Tax=Blattamonas nauphoetae TaxID=2049346 RepID=A0ABQ9XSI2_9EUKA|nr:hypothetical protein BLNAU_11402 [Blattamonas nauphoetae]
MGSVSLISTSLTDGHHSVISPIIANRQTESFLIQSSSFRNITSNSPEMHPHLTTPAGKTIFLNTQTENVHQVFYGTLTNDINLDGSFLFSNNTFLRTTQSNTESFTCADEECTIICPAGGCTSGYSIKTQEPSPAQYVTFKDSLFRECYQATSGGAINCHPHNSGVLTVQDSEFQNCSSGYHAGGVYFRNCDAIVHHNTFNDCRAAMYAGAFLGMPHEHTTLFFENTCTLCWATLQDTTLHINNADRDLTVHNNTFSTSFTTSSSDVKLIAYSSSQASHNLFQNHQTSLHGSFQGSLVIRLYTLPLCTIFGNKFEWDHHLPLSTSWPHSPDVAVILYDSFTTPLPLVDSTGFFLPPSKKNDVTTTKDDTSNFIFFGLAKASGVYPYKITAPADSTSPFFSCSGQRNVLIRQFALDLSAAPISFAEISSGEVVVSEIDFTVSTTALTTDFMKVSSATLTLDTILLTSLTLTSASVINMEGTSTLSVSGSEFKSISQTESGGGAFLRTNGDSNQIVSIRSSSFESVSSVGDGGVILAQLGAGSKLTVATTTFKLCSSSGKGGALSIELTSTGSFALEAGTSFESCSATGSGSAVFVEAPSLASAITKTSLAFLAPFPLTPTAAMVDMHRGWNTVNTSDDVPLVLFLAEVGSTGYASSSGSDGELCGFSVYPCSSLSTLQTRLAANGSKTEGKLNPITLELQTALAQSTPFSCGGHKATITGNTITLSNLGEFTTSSSDSALTFSSLSLYFALSQTQPAISVSTGLVVVSGCTIGNGDADIPVSFGSVSGGSLKLNGTNTFKLISKFYPLFVVSSGTLKIESGTSLTHSATTRRASLFDLSGGSTTIESLVVPSLVFDSASSVFSLTNTASLYLSSIAFNSISNEGSGSVIHSTTTGTLSLSSVSFTSCSSSGNGGALFIKHVNDLECYSVFFDHCSASKCGGGMSLTLDAPIDLGGITFQQCSAEDGGGLFVEMGGDARLQYSYFNQHYDEHYTRHIFYLFEGCTASNGGGQLSVNGTSSDPLCLKMTEEDEVFLPFLGGQLNSKGSDLFVHQSLVDSVGLANIVNSIKTSAWSSGDSSGSS